MGSPATEPAFPPTNADKSMLDRSLIGSAFKPFSIAVEPSRLKFFANVIGETDPVFFDRTAAEAAGYKDVMVPPTFLWCLEMQRANPLDTLDLLGIDIAKILHGEQSFRYFKSAYSGDMLTYKAHIADIYDKKKGQLEFVVRETQIINQDDVPVAELRTTVIVRND
jgi:acyl dehydratase